MKTDLFTLNKYLGVLLGAIISYLKYGENATYILFGSAFGYGVSFLITIMVILAFEGRQKLEDFQYPIFRREMLIFSFKSEKFLYIIILIYLMVFSAAAKLYNPDLTMNNALIFGFIATSLFTGTTLIIHANILLLTISFAALVLLNIAISYFNISEFSRDSLIVIYFPLSFFFVSGYIEEYKRLEYEVLMYFFDDDDFDDIVGSVFKRDGSAVTGPPASDFKKLSASVLIWISLLSTVNFDFSFFHSFLSAIKN